jgi:hypothetical protein
MLANRHRTTKWKGSSARLAISVAIVTAGAVMSLTAPAGAASTPAAQLPQRVGSAPHAADAVRLGALATSTALRVDVTLLPRNPDALAAFATDVSTPGSEQFRHYLERGQFASRFGPTVAAIEAVDRQLRAAGLRPGAISSNHLVIPVAGTAASLARAFRTGFTTYRMPGGRTAFANSAAPYLGPAARYVQAVIGLNNLYLPQRIGLVRPKVNKPLVARQEATTGPQPCSTAVSDAPGQDAYTANQIASAYNFTSIYGAGDLGAGITVALFELEPNLTTDVAAYQSCYGTSATVNYIKEDGGAGTGAGEGEAALDIEDVIGLAPDVTVDVYQAPNSNIGLIDNYTAIVDADSAKAVSTSWGECEADSGSSIISEEGTLFEQAASQGQAVFAAAGDSGSSDCGTSSLDVDDPASQPYVTGVGGTTTTSTTAPPAQTVWNDSSVEGGAGGGGVSLSHVMPSYQSGAPSSLHVINANSSGSQCGAASGSYCREVPDVSASADEYHGYLIYYDGSWIGIGGTSAAAPLWAAFAALTDASSSCGGKSIGFANPVLYDAAANAYSSNFFDVTSGNNDYTPNGYSGGLYPAGTGYDMASGLGTPNGANLPATLCSGGTTANTVTVANPGSQTSTVGTAVSLQLSATDSASGQTLTWSATGLPAGLSISSSGLISGPPTTSGGSSVTVTAKDTTGASGSASFSWTVNAVQANTVTVANPGSQTSTVGTAVSLQLSATDSASGQTLTWSATGLPAGLSISSSGLISGAPTTSGGSSVTVTAKDTTGASGSASFSWTVNAISSCVASQLLLNPGFESGNVDWSATPSVIVNNREADGYEVAEAGSWFSWLDGYGVPHTDTLAQTVTVPSGCASYVLSYYQHIDTSERSSTCNGCDTLKLQVLNSSGTVLATLSTYTNLNAAAGYHNISVNMAAYAGQKITIKWTGTETDQGRGTTDFLIDTTAFNVSNAAATRELGLQSNGVAFVTSSLIGCVCAARTTSERRAGLVATGDGRQHIGTDEAAAKWRLAVFDTWRTIHTRIDTNALR